MKNRYYTSYLIFSLIFFFVLVIYSLLTVSSEYRKGSEEGLNYFNRLKSNLTTVYLSNEEFSSPSFRKKINQLFDSNSSLQSLVIASESGQVDYMYVKNRALLSEMPVSVPDYITKPEYSFNPLFFKLISDTVIIPGNSNFNLEIVYSILDYSDMVNLAKILILILLVFILLTLFFLLFVPNPSNRQPAPSSAKNENKVQIKPGSVTVKAGQMQQDAPAHPATAPNPDTPDNDTSAVSEPVMPQNGENGPYLSEPDEAEKETDKTHEAIKTDIETGLGWFEYFYSKLEYELEKSTSFDNDLTLCLVTVSGQEKPEINALFRKLPETINIFFSPEMSFEYNSSSFAVILQDSSLEEAITKINAFLIQLRHLSGMETIYAGASSRNGRLISARRLTQEAEGALQKAVSESDSPLIAFRSDPEKFREVVSGKKSG